MSKYISVSANSGNGGWFDNIVTSSDSNITVYPSWWCNCPRCKGWVQSSDNYCRHCGADLTKKYCPHCGKEI